MLLDDCAVLLQQYRTLCEDFALYANERPDVENIHKLRRRASRDLTALEKFSSSLNEEDIDPIWFEQKRNQLQGFRNNLVGYQVKLKVAKVVPGVIALSKIFQFPLAPGVRKKGVPPESKPTSKAVKVEVDIVANSGSTWIQVRNVKITDLDNLHWIGMPGHHKGLEQKLKDLVLVAKSSEHWIRWRPPDVVIYCPEQFPTEVESEIRQLGGHCITGDLENLKQIPAAPGDPEIVNLDVTTLCALVSEVSHSGPRNSLVIQWAKKVSHWQRCLEQEEEDPLLPHLHKFVSNSNLIIAEEAVDQFETLLDLCGGPKEKDRWTELFKRLTVFKRDCETEWWISQRVLNIEELTNLQYAVFGLGDSQRATTITCNSKVVAKLKQNGVHLVTFEHRAVWLTGL
eukprot:g8293.t1